MTHTVTDEMVQIAWDIFSGGMGAFPHQLTSMRDALTAALSALTQGGVKVKELEWEEQTYSLQDSEVIGWNTDNTFGTFYHVQIETDGFHTYYDGKLLGIFSTEHEAKAAAQADFDTRIRSALSTMLQEPVEEVDECDQGDNGECSRAECRANNYCCVGATLDHQPVTAGWTPTHRHVKRGSEYEHIGTGRIQSDTPLKDMVYVEVYLGREGDLWARKQSEFFDGRFVALKSEDRT